MTEEEKNEHIRLLALNRRFSELKHFLDQEAENESRFVQFIDAYIKSNGLKRNAIIMRAGIELKYGYKLLNCQKKTGNRDLILRLCFAMYMNELDTNQALHLYKMACLDRNDRRDCLIAAALGLQKSTAIYELNEWLIALNLQPLIAE